MIDESININEDFISRFTKLSDIPKTWVQFPGNVALALAPQNHTGCKPVIFSKPSWAPWRKSPAEQMNHYFNEIKGQLIVSVTPMPDGGLLVFHTCSLTDAQMHVLETRAGVVERETARILEQEEAQAKFQQEKEAKALAAAQVQASKELESLKSLADKGESCAKNHGGKHDIREAKRQVLREAANNIRALCANDGAMSASDCARELDKDANNV